MTISPLGDVFSADQRFQPRGVAPDRDGIAGQQGKREVAAAGALHGMDQRPAGAGHQSDSLGLGDRLGDFDGASLHAAGLQRGQHLKHDRAARGKSLNHGALYHAARTIRRG